MLQLFSRQLLRLIVGFLEPEEESNVKDLSFPFQNILRYIRDSFGAPLFGRILKVCLLDVCLHINASSLAARIRFVSPEHKVLETRMTVSSFRVATTWRRCPTASTTMTALQSTVRSAGLYIVTIARIMLESTGLSVSHTQDLLQLGSWVYPSKQCNHEFLLKHRDLASEHSITLMLPLW